MLSHRAVIVAQLAAWASESTDPSRRHSREEYSILQVCSVAFWSTVPARMRWCYLFT